MADYSMRFQIPKTLAPTVARNRFFWVRDSTRDSFVSTLLPRHEALGPRLAALGPVSEANVDLVRLAVMVYAADRSTPRRAGATNWSRRDLGIEVPASDPSAWEPVRANLERLLGFLSGDTWTLRFRKARPPKEQVRGDRFAGAKRVVLLSGGADSAVGALLSRHDLGDDSPQVLASHVGMTTLAPTQERVAKRIAELINGPVQFHQQIHFSRHATQLDGSYFRKETSTRTRSFLFLALGLAIASIEGVPLWIPENGFASLNLPLTADQRGSLSTRTTHPLFLEQFGSLVSAAGAHGQIRNPLECMTKGEMFGCVTDLIGHKAADFLSATHSCSHTGHRSFGISPLEHCGVCFGCLLRRASFLAAGLTDKTSYLAARTADRPDAYLRSKSMEPSLRAFLARGLRASDLASLTLPASYSTATARSICERAISELELLFP